MQQELKEMCTNTLYMVDQANVLIKSKQKLSLNATKLIRLTLMQIKKDDKDFNEVYISVQDLAKALNIAPSNLYRDIDSITSEIFTSFIYMRKDGGFKKYSWVSSCSYSKKEGIRIRINNELKPYLLGLKGNYTQYQIGEILNFKSQNTIRLYELFMTAIYTKILPKEGVNVYFTVQELEEYLDCEDTEFKTFKQNILDKSLKEINSSGTYLITYSKEGYVKAGRKITGIYFNINTTYH